MMSHERPHKLILIEIDDGLSLIPCPGLVLRRSKLTKDQCTLFLPGQSPHEGFLLDRPYDEVAEELAGVLEQHYQPPLEQQFNLQED